MEESGIERLPTDCIAHIISLTSPPDACRCAGLSSTFCFAASHETVWERFLTQEFQSLLDRSADPIPSSKRDIFVRLGDWVLLDGGRMGVRLEKPSWAKCFMLPARTLTKESIKTFAVSWRWIPVADSRFSEAAILIGGYGLDIRGTIQSNILSRNTTYEAFLVFKLANWSRGFDRHPRARYVPKASVALGLQSSTKKVWQLSNYTSDIPFPTMNGDENDDNHHGVNDDDVDNDDDNDHGANVVEDDNDDNDDVDNADYFDIEVFVLDDDKCDYDFADSAVIRVRDDGWLEFSMGNVYNEEGEDGEMTMTFKEREMPLIWKKGLVILGIEIRPTI